MDVLDWLLDSDPSIRWQALRDLTDAPADQVTSERARVAEEGWGARLLALRDPDGLWAHGACFPNTADLHRQAAEVHAVPPAAESDAPADEDPDERPGQPWTATYPTLDLLRELGIDPTHPVVRETTALVAVNCLWEEGGQPFFAGEVEPCINGRTLRLAHYYGHAEHADAIAARLLGEQLDDGGWNCEAERGSTRSSFHSTLSVLVGLLAHEQATGGTEHLHEARRTGEEYLLTRHLMRRLSTGEIVEPSWLDLSFPTQWYYDVLHCLEYFREVGAAPDPRLGEALDVVRGKRQPEGRWLLENTHPGARHFPLEDGDGQPSRWNTLRALRVLRWAESAD
jgi:hypothetical protein